MSSPIDDPAFSAISPNTALDSQFFPLFQSAAIGVAKVGLDCSWLWVNRKLCDITGYGESELVGKAFGEITHPDDLEADLSNMRQVVAGELDINVLEKRYVRKDGSLVWVQLNATLVRDEAGEPDYFIVLVEDISERKMAGEQLRESERRFRSVFENAMDLISVMDNEGRYTEVNPAVCDFLGLRAEEIIGRKPLQLFGLADEENFDHAWRELISEKRTVESEFQLFHQDGTVRDIQASTITHFLPGLHLTTGRDITEQKKSEAAMRETQERLQRLLAGTHDGFWEWNLVHNTSYWSERFSEILGLPHDRKSDPNQGWLWIHPEDRDMVRRKVEESIRERIPYVNQFRMKHTDGRYVWVHAKAQITYDESGQAIWMAGSYSDVTDKVLAEQALRESEERYRSIFDTVYDGVWEWDMKTNEVFWNDRLYAMHGLDPASFTPTLESFLEIVHPDDREMVQQALKNHLEGDVPYQLEIRQRYGETGEYKTFFARGSVLRDEQGNPYRVVGATIDITERKKWENALLESEERFRTMAEAATVMIVITEKGGRVTYVNKACLEFFGYSFEELAELNWAEFIHPDDRDDHWKNFSAGLESGDRFNLEFRMRRKEGDYRWIYADIAPIQGENGEVIGHIGANIDITPRKEAQDELNQYARKLELSNKELETFATVASHDLQAPLRKVMMFSQYIAETDGSKLSEEGKDYIARMQRATRKMQHLITDLLDLSRVNRKGHPFKPVDLNKVLGEALADLEMAMKKANAAVEVADLPTIDADAVQMEQLFRNLIENSLKFHRPDVPPVIRVSAREISGDQYVIELEDNGIGFDSSYADRIFQVFERLHGEAYEGTGIGLALCHKIVERHAGTITASGTPGAGANFTITLPARQK